jgi:hypothetical protein
MQLTSLNKDLISLKKVELLKIVYTYFTAQQQIPVRHQIL